MSCNSPIMAALGFGGGLLHVVNHSLFKGLLFLGAGAVAHASGTREIDTLGGLLKRMPWTGATFLVGSVGHLRSPAAQRVRQRVSDLSGSVSWRTRRQTGAWRSPAWLMIGGLALIGGLAVACFTKAFGVVFLGEPRTERTLPFRRSGRLCSADGDSGRRLSGVGIRCSAGIGDLGGARRRLTPGCRGDDRRVCRAGASTLAYVTVAVLVCCGLAVIVL